MEDLTLRLQVKEDTERQTVRIGLSPLKPMQIMLTEETPKCSRRTIRLRNPSSLQNWKILKKLKGPCYFYGKLSQKAQDYHHRNDGNQANKNNNQANMTITNEELADVVSEITWSQM